MAAAPCQAQSEQATPPTGAAANPSITDTIDAAETDGEGPGPKVVKWNEYQGPHFTVRVGGGFLYDFAAYSQDADSKEQMTLRPSGQLRDFRFLFKGRFPSVPRLSYTLG